MSPVAQHADDFSGQSFVQDFHCGLAVGVIAFGYGAMFDVLAGALAQEF